MKGEAHSKHLLGCNYYALFLAKFSYEACTFPKENFKKNLGDCNFIYRILNQKIYA